MTLQTSGPFSIFSDGGRDGCELDGAAGESVRKEFGGSVPTKIINTSSVPRGQELASSRLMIQGFRLKRFRC